MKQLLVAVPLALVAIGIIIDLHWRDFLLARARAEQDRIVDTLFELRRMLHVYELYARSTNMMATTNRSWAFDQTIKQTVLIHDELYSLSKVTRRIDMLERHRPVWVRMAR